MNAMYAKVMAPKPEWAIRARYGAGMLLGTLPRGYASSPEDAIAAWMRLRGLEVAPPDVMALPKPKAR